MKKILDSSMPWVLIVGDDQHNESIGRLSARYNVVWAENYLLAARTLAQTKVSYVCISQVASMQADADEAILLLLTACQLGCHTVLVTDQDNANTFLFPSVFTEPLIINGKKAMLTTTKSPVNWQEILEKLLS